MTDASVSFIVPVRSDAHRLRQCLRSIAANYRPAFDVEVLVVDHESTDDSAVVARQGGALVLRACGGGPSSLRNLAARHAAGSVLAFIDADHEIVDSWLPAALETLALPGVGAAGASYEPPPSGTWVQCLYGALRGRTEGCRDVEWLGAGNLAVHADAFARVGGFDPALETCEDVDLCQRLKQAGYRVVADERLGSVHHGDPATLRALLLGEVWRGRDNIRVSLRSPWRLRAMPSLLVPVVEASIPIVAALGFFVSWRVSLAVSLAGLTVVAGVSAARAWVLVTRLREWSAVTMLRALAVSATYDLGRAAALVLRVGHGRRRPAVLTQAADA
jgi:glycosyltransferase involved in cell wall biosynthesis